MGHLCHCVYSHKSLLNEWVAASGDLTVNNFFRLCKSVKDSVIISVHFISQCVSDSMQIFFISPLVNLTEVLLDNRIDYYIYMQTYIIGHYNLSVRITAYLLTPLMLYGLILYVSCGTYLLRNFFIAGLFTLRVFARNLLRGIRRRNIFFISRFDG